MGSLYILRFAMVMGSIEVGIAGSSVEMLKHIRNQCTGLVTLRMELNVSNVIAIGFTNPYSLGSQVLYPDWLYEQLQAVPFLRDIFIHIQVLDKESFLECQDLQKLSQELGWKFEVTGSKRTGNEDDDYAPYFKAAFNLANMELRSRAMQLGYHIKRKTTDGKYEIDYELSFRVACRKVEEALLQSAEDEPTAIRESHP